MKTKILGVSGKKQSGKNTTTNYIVGLWVKALELCDDFRINSDGKLVLKWGDYESLFDIEKDTDSPLYNELKDFVRVYSFADLLKRHVCIDILGLSEEQCFGTDAQKDSLTHLLWEDMPGVTTIKTQQDVVDKEVAGRLGKYYEKMLGGMIYHEPGFMTSRQVMQFVGTEIFRKMYGNVWVDATIRKILKDGVLMALISDTRFPNEVLGLRNQGGLVMRLTKDVFKGEDQHESETALDDYPLDGYDIVIDNESMSIEEQLQAVYKELKQHMMIPHSTPKV